MSIKVDNDAPQPSGLVCTFARKATAIQTVSLSLYRFDAVIDRLWALAMMGGARRPLSRVPGLSFHKLCGAGTGEGFTPIPDTGVCAILGVWPDMATAKAQTDGAAIFQRYAARASERLRVLMVPISARGAWAGGTPFTAQADPGDGPVAALTRATIRPRIALRFWNRVPDISRAIGTDPNVMFKIGIGEVPLLHQVTFSIWPGPAEMAAFARVGGPHARAIKAVRDGDWFAEELYARFRVCDMAGTWGGRDPLRDTTGGA